MRNLKLFSAALAMLLSSAALSAQSDPVKETVIIDLFTGTGHVKDYIRDGVRAGVIQGFTEKGRFNLVDAATNAEIVSLNANRNTEVAVTAENVLNADAVNVYKALGAKYLLKGQVTSITTVDTKNIITGNPEKKTTIAFSMTVYNIADGSTVGSEICEAMGFAKNTHEAEDSACKDAKDEARKFVDKHFKFTTFIEQLGEVHKKKGLIDVYIVGGIEMGVEKNQLFKVYVKKQIGSRWTQQEIGKLKAVEPMDGLSRCVVQKGNIEIAEIFNTTGKEALVVVSEPKFWDQALN